MDGCGCVWTWEVMYVCDGYDGYDRCGWIRVDMYWYVRICRIRWILWIFTDMDGYEGDKWIWTDMTDVVGYECL